MFFAAHVYCLPSVLLQKDATVHQVSKVADSKTTPSTVLFHSEKDQFSNDSWVKWTDLVLSFSLFIFYLLFQTSTGIDLLPSVIWLP